MFKFSRKVIILVALVWSLGCAGTIATQLPEDASQEHVYLAAFETYEILQKDINAYLALPSVSKEDAMKIDAYMDRAELQIELVRIALASGEEVKYDLAIQAINAAIVEICWENEEIAECGGR